MAIKTVVLSNTFNEFRTTSNEVINRINQFEAGDATANINLLTANNVVVNTDLASNLYSTISNTQPLVLNTNYGANSGSIIIESGDTGNVVITANSVGTINLSSSTIISGNSASDVTMTSNGSYDLIINTNSGTNSGFIRIYDGVNGNIEIGTNGTGDVFLNADTVRIGDTNANATLTTRGTGDLILSTNTGTNSGTIRIYDGANASIDIEPNGIGDVNLITDTLRVGSSNENVIITTNGTGDVTISTNAGTNSGTIKIFDGNNGNVDVTTVGTGKTNVRNLTASTQITSTVATGTAPLSVASTTVIPNLNSDKVDGIDVATPSAAGGIVYASTTSELSTSAAGTAGQAVISGGTGSPTFQTVASANGASTIVSRNAAGDFSSRNVTVTKIIGNGSELTNLNASNISSGVIGNDKTTGASASGASTLVLRDATGSFSANVVTATTIAASGFAGNGSGLNSLNASNISLGTIENTRTTGNTSNSSNTLVLRDAAGSFSANVITLTTLSTTEFSTTNASATNLSATNISGSGAGITSLNGSNIASGTVPNGRTTGTAANSPNKLVLRDADGSFNANVGAFNTVTGVGSGLTSLNASSITLGTLTNDRTTANTLNSASTLVVRDTDGSFAANVITSQYISANGALLSSLNASSISFGTIPNDRTSANTSNSANTLVLRDANGDFSSRRITSTIATGTSPFVVSSTTVVSNLNADKVDGKDVGTLSAAGGIVYASSTTALAGSAAGTAGQAVISGGTGSPTFQTVASANGASTIIARDTTGSFSANVGTFNFITISSGIGGDGSLLSNLNASNILLGTIENTRTTGNTSNSANTLVLRDANGDFSTRRITLSVPTGTAPLVINSTTSVTNLNADLLDGQHGSYYLDWTNTTNKPDPVVTVTLTGDVTGTANTTLTDLANGTISISTSIATNSVALGTDTTGNYVASVTAGSGITVSGTAGEGWTANVAHADTSTQASVNNSNGTVIQDITLDTFGHITAIGSTNLDTRYDARYLSFKTLEVTDTNSGYNWSSAGNVVADLYDDRLKFVDGDGVDISADETNDAILIQHTDTSTLNGAQGTAGIASITVDGFGHVTAVTTATYLSSTTNGFGIVAIDNTDAEYTWSVADGANVVADSIPDAVTFVAAKTGSTYGIQMKANTALDAIGISHADTSTLSGTQGSSGVASITVDEMGHVTAVTTATYLTAEADTLATVTGRGATTATAISITNTTASTSTTTGALKVSGGVGIAGALNATSKSFIIKHPTKSGMLLRYGSLEGPEFGVYVRGRLTGTNVIKLPDYWVGLVHEDTITVSLTPYGAHQNLYVTKIEDNEVHVNNVTLAPVDCFYTIFAERKDVEKLTVEYSDGAV